MSSLRRGWRQYLCSIVAVCVVAAPSALAQININSSPNAVGSGARALGMGGAFIAVADDATAASWNPGGLTQLERPELSLVYSWKWFNEDFGSGPYLTADGNYDISLDELNYLSFVYPIPRTIAGRNLVLSLNYQTKYDFDRQIDFRARMIQVSQFFQNFTNVVIDYHQQGSLSALSPALGFELTDRLSLGMAVNIWDSSLIPNNEWESVTERRAVVNQFINIPGFGNLSQLIPGQANTYETYENLEGINYTFGLLFKPTERLSIGAVYHTGYSTDVDYTRINRVRNPFGVQYYKTRLRIEWPAAIGVGVAYRFPNDKLTVSLDVTRRNWDSFVQRDLLPRRDPRTFFARHMRYGLGTRLSPVTGLPKQISPHDPTYSIRLGAEYVFVDPKRAKQNYLPSLRAGVFYDPEPASGRETKWWGITQGDGKPDCTIG